MDGLIALKSDTSEAIVSVLGAELVSWQVCGCELLWRKDPVVWDKISPILFPTIGWCNGGRLKAGGKSYPMPVHGFAANSRFGIDTRSKDKVAFVLSDDEVTRHHYPFAFEFSVSYRLSGPSLEITLDVFNPGEEMLPYACGVHPGFAIPFAGGRLEDYCVVFSDNEASQVPSIAAGGLISYAMRPVPIDGKRIPLNPSVFEQEALCFLNAKSHSVALERTGPASDSLGRIEMAVDNFPHLAIWSKPRAPFVSLEAWAGYGDRVGFAGDIVDKPGMIHLPPGGAGQHRATLMFDS